MQSSLTLRSTVHDLSKKTFRCHCLPLSLPLAPPTRQVYVAAIKRVEGRAGLAGPREPDGTPAAPSAQLNHSEQLQNQPKPVQLVGYNVGSGRMASSTSVLVRQYDSSSTILVLEY